MSSIKLKHASGNSMSIAAPATNPASDLELKLPATVGTAGQALVNSSTAGTLEFGTVVKSGANTVSTAGDVGYSFENSNTTSGFGMKIKGGGTDADRYIVRFDDAAGNDRVRIRTNGTITSNHGSNSITAGGWSQANYFGKQFVNSNFAGLQLEANGNDAVAGISQADDNVSFFQSYRSSAGYLKAEFRIGGSVRMTMATNGVISGDFNDTSDAKLKENVTSIADGALASIKQLRPVTFDWKNLGKEAETGHDSITGPTNVSGFLAQEVKPLIPSVVEGTEWDESKPNGDRYSINTNGLVAHLTKALQEAITKIETLETKVAALEAA